MNRRAAAIGALLTVAVGLASRRLHAGWWPWDKSVGDVAYTVLIGLLIAVVRPQTSARAIAASSIAISFAIELFQLTGIPKRAPTLLRAALGDTFAWHDMACYVVGGALVGALALRSSRAARSASPSS